MCYFEQQNSFIHVYSTTYYWQFYNDICVFIIATRTQASKVMHFSPLVGVLLHYLLYLLNIGKPIKYYT